MLNAGAADACLAQQAVTISGHKLVQHKVMVSSNPVMQSASHSPAEHRYKTFKNVVTSGMSQGHATASSMSMKLVGFNEGKVARLIMQVCAVGN